jgi:hypothetical protein
VIGHMMALSRLIAEADEAEPVSLPTEASGGPSSSSRASTAISNHAARAGPESL